MRTAGSKGESLLIDTHCHLNDREAFPDPGAEVRDATERAVGLLLVVGVDPAGWERALELAHSFPPVFAICGWHPNYTAGYGPESLEMLRAVLRDDKVVAVGEIGLDFHWSYSRPAQQVIALRDQLDLADELEMPVVFHARDAVPDLLGLLEARKSLTPKYLLHCFSGDSRDAARAVALGCYFGVDGPITYKNAKDLRAIVQTIPRDRLVIETDSPYLTPVPHRGKPNRPAYVEHVNRGLAEALGVSERECAELTTENARRFFEI